MHKRIYLWALFLSGISFSVSLSLAAGQSKPPTHLGRPDKILSERFSRVVGVRELPNGRVLILDPQEPRLVLGDFDNDTSEQVGRLGSGPGEYRQPTRLIPLVGDSTGIYDPANGRILLISPLGSVAGFWGGLGPPGPAFSHRAATAMADSLGRLYARVLPARSEPDGADSAVIERLTQGVVETVTKVPFNKPKGTPIGTADGYTFSQPAPEPPFQPVTLWSVSPAGEVAIIYSSPYRVVFVRTSSLLVGRPIPWERVRLTAKHKLQWHHEQSAVQVVSTIQRGNSSNSYSAQRTPYREPTNWPEYLPPFLAGAALFDRSGTLWVRVTTEADSPPTYDLIGRDGELIQKVTLNADCRVVGFGRGSVFVSCTDSDGLDSLQRFRWLRH